MKSRRAEILAVLEALLLIGGFTAVLLFGGLHRNLTDSVPIGIYREAQDGHYVAFCLPLTVLEQAKRNGLALDAGSCPGAVTPILKTFYSASPGNPIDFSSAGFSVNGKLLANTAPKSHSRTGTTLAHYPFGTYNSGLWAVSDFNPDSYDSRYFGPIEPGSILYHLEPFLITTRRINAAH